MYLIECSEGRISTAGGGVTLGIIADLYQPDYQDWTVTSVVLSSVGGTSIGWIYFPWIIRNSRIIKDKWSGAAAGASTQVFPVPRAIGINRPIRIRVDAFHSARTSLNYPHGRLLLYRHGQLRNIHVNHQLQVGSVRLVLGQCDWWKPVLPGTCRLALQLFIQLCSTPHPCTLSSGRDHLAAREVQVWQVSGCGSESQGGQSRYGGPQRELQPHNL